ncbi:coiled-coil domain-containing protein 191 [Hippoglossus hippoglossus]|uniref:coiled-coil domain-containing protein 191 n=1 Tax=Hippoglossus hippoglossus TaxID=8267 RepID=UPI00148C6A4D|nr:coiled-coil domain-containing protein 191 [Hippoglossus hippoglossus]
MMTFPGHNPHLSRWRSLNRSKTSADKVHVKNGDIDQWRKRVEMASEFAVSKVFSHKTPQSRSSSRAVPLQSSDQLKEHDDAYSEAQALLNGWLGSKMRSELEVEEEDDLTRSTGRRRPVAPACTQPTAPDYDSFDDLYNCLTEEEEYGSVKSFLQGLMEQEVLDSGMMEELVLDVGQSRKKFRDPLITMEARHQQVRENRAQRDAERQSKQREREAQRGAREEAKRREREEEARKKQEAHRQAEMVQQEMVRLRRQMEERKGPDRLIRQRERERMEGQKSTSNLQSAPTHSAKQQQQDAEQLYREQAIQTMLHLSNLKCLQRHFSEWYSVVLDRRLRMGKAGALSDWKRKLRAWRGWRTVVWAEQRQREVARTEERLRTENRQCQLAVESDRRRLLKHCVNEWRLWCRKEREQRELLAQQQETRRKMAALISAASTGKLKPPGAPLDRPIMAPHEASNPPETRKKGDHHRSGSLARNASALHKDKMPARTAAQPTQPWQVTRRHAAPTAAELQDARQQGVGGGFASSKSTTSPSDRFENRHAIQQQVIAQQRRLLKVQQEQIAQLKEEQSVKGLEEETEKTAQFSQPSKRRGSRPKSRDSEPTEQREQRVSAETDNQRTPPRKAVTCQTCPPPIISAMEARARQRTERRKEIEELKRKKEEEKLAEMKAAEEQRKSEEEEEKRRAAEKRREEKRLEREREEESKRQVKRQQELLKVARQHYLGTLLLRRGLAPWKRLIQLKRANTQLAESHHNLLLLKSCTLGWQQSTREALSGKEASADQLHRHCLLQRSLSCWMRLRDWRRIQQEQAERFYRTRTLRRFLLALLNYVTQERLDDWDRRELAQKHNNRRVLRRCFLAWRPLPCLLRRERQRETRREKLGRKVSEVLPDFCSLPPLSPWERESELPTHTEDTQTVPRTLIETQRK